MKRMRSFFALLLCALLLGGACPAMAAAEGPLELSYYTYGGAGMEYTVTVMDEGLVSVERERRQEETEEPGSAYEEVFRFTGLRAGETLAEIRGSSSVYGYSWTALFRLVVDEKRNVTREELPELEYLYYSRNGDMVPENWEAGRFGDRYLVGRDESYFSTDPELLEELRDLVFRYGVDGWDGFNESDPYVLDGEGFTLQLRFDDGTEVRAYGSNAFPPQYFTAMAALRERIESAYAEGQAAQNAYRTPQAVDLYFPANPSAGYAWTWESEDLDLVEVKEEYFGPESLLGSMAQEMGTPGTQWYHFNGLAPGIGSIELRYARSWEDGEPLTRFVFYFQVNENLDLHIWGVEMY